jgi:hypothetical protein
VPAFFGLADTLEEKPDLTCRKWQGDGYIFGCQCKQFGDFNFCAGVRLLGDAFAEIWVAGREEQPLVYIELQKVN